MSPHPHQDDKQYALRLHKAELIERAERHRDAIVLAKQHIKYGAQPEVIIHNVIDHATYALRSRADALLTPTGLSVTAVAPYALKILAMLRRRGKLKPALGIAALLGGIGWYINRRRQHHFLAQ